MIQPKREGFLLLQPYMNLTCAILLTTFCASMAHSESIDLLEDPDAWLLENTSEGIYSIQETGIRAKRRSYESATILSREDFENFRMAFEFKLRKDCELIFLMHAPRNGAYGAGLELVLSDHVGKTPTPFTAGALFGLRPGLSNPIRRENEWNTCEVLMDWPRLRVTLNDEVIQDLDLSEHEDLRYKLRRGAFGYRDLLGWGYELRNMSLEPLPDSEGSLVMFNGKNLKGWKEVRKGDATFTVRDGVIVGENGNGYLQYKQSNYDFDLRLYYRTTPTANGGVFFRWKSDDSERGNEIQILDVGQATSPSGTIYNVERASGVPMRPGEWHLMQVSVRGSHAITHLDGIRAAETHELVNLWPGHITLQMHKENSTIEFKDLILVVHD